MSKLLKFMTALLFLVVPVQVVFGANPKIETKPATNLNSWREEFDLDSRSEGKYNIYITAKDMGGNEYQEGPHNIRYDKNSDLPITGITNPYANMRVVGNLNIVGTCIDDDGVSKVELVLDEGTAWEKTVTAEGTDFWSYYLDTNDLEEGPHTIRVIGYDINNEPRINNPKKVKADHSTVTWQLDRKQPVTSVPDRSMGMLVSGTVKLEGLVEDGNGIDQLFYSIDNGKTFKNIKISKTKVPSQSTFNLSIDTKKFEDGAKVLWFKAFDKSGSVGLSSFLLFVDNTKPDVKIISPKQNEVLQGKFTVAGYAKDTVGVTSLSWTFGNENGEIELIPGNPYWAVDVDSSKIKDKTVKFTVHAADRIGNLVDETMVIPLNQDDDKPVVTVYEPENNQIFSGDEKIIARGFAKDNIEVKYVKIQFDMNEPFIQETNGDYCFDFGPASSLPVGKHRISVTAVDINDTVGNSFVTEFENKGFAPTYSNAKVSIGKDSLEFVNGMEVHPESESVFSVVANAPVGLKTVTTKLTFNGNVVSEETVEFKSQGVYTASLPIKPETPKGIIYYTVHAVDIYDRESEYTAMLYVTNTSKVSSEDAKIVFGGDVESDGSVFINREYPITGYVIGANAKEVTLIPAVNDFGISARLSGNQIIFSYGNHSDKIGATQPITVRVTTDKGHIVDSDMPLVFKEDKALPKITIDIPDYNKKIIEAKDDVVYISGTVTCPTEIALENGLQYRVLKVTPSYDAKTNFITKIAEDAANSKAEFQPVSVMPDGSFKVPFVLKETVSKVVEKQVEVEREENAEDEEESEEPEYETVTETVYETKDTMSDGIYVVEFVARSAGGKIAVNAAAFSKITKVATDMSKAKPQVLIIDGYEDYAKYAVSVFQGALVNPEASYEEAETFKIFTTEGFAAGETKEISFKALSDSGLETVATGSIAKNVELDVNIKSIKLPRKVTRTNPETDETYEVIEPQAQNFVNGTIVVLPYRSSNGSSLVVSISTKLPVSSVSYDISGEMVPGARNSIVGNVKPVADGDGKWLVEIPFNDLPVRENEVTVTVKAGNLTKSAIGKILVVRENSQIDDEEKVYGFAPAETVYRASDATYLLNNGAPYYFYANCNSPAAQLSGAAEGLNLEQFGNLFKVTAEKDGSFKDIKLVVTDKYGDTYSSQSLNFIADTQAPEIILHTPELHSWLSNEMVISGTVTDGTGVKLVEYTVDGTNWIQLSTTGPETGVTFNETVSLADVEDGLVRLTLRATDIAEQKTYYYTSGCKDTLPPEVTVLEPLDQDVVNGEILVVFDAKDNFALSTVEYQNNDESVTAPVEINPLIHTYVGTADKPIADDMVFVFADKAGNVTKLNAWQFLIDSQSDLPRCEIHVPEENQVITRDFTISGVVYDDDGEATIFYKIDDGEFHQIPEMGTSFAIDVPLSAMTDNEHTVTVYAVDINGVQGEEVSKTFRISLEEPKGAVELPRIETSVKGKIRVSGWASDKNGIAKVQISLDNGNSYSDASGLEEWYYDFDTRVIPGGTQVVFLKVTDGYGIQGLYSSLINVDNEAPSLNLELPLDDSKTTGDLFFSGYTYDNVEVSELYVTIRNLELPGDPLIKNIKIDRIIGEVIDIRDLPDGFYNIELTGKDRAGNISNVSRNIHLEKDKDPGTVDILYPLNGTHKQGEFTVYGQAQAEYGIQEVRLYIDGELISTTELTDSGFFKFGIGGKRKDAIQLEAGVHTYRVDTILENGMAVPSGDQTITYNPYGPWITIDNFTYGDFATDRPFIKGRAGYALDPADVELYKSKEATEEFKADYNGRKIEKIEISFDNGKTFTQVSKNGSWKYRIENQDIAEGYHFFMVRATMANGEIAINRTIIQIDNTAPRIKLISPVVNGSYNQTLNVSGLSSDDVKLEDVNITLRRGDKSSYGVPALIQGLYLDFHFLGSTFFDVGAGLTFFDDVVKLQVQWGQYTQDQRNIISNLLHQPPTNMRYGGDNVWGVKVLANVYTLPFSRFLGRDFDWLYASFAIGAQFTWFNDGGFKTDTNAKVSQTLSAMIVQMEFPLLKFKKNVVFSQMSFYTEFSMWFIPSDVSSTDAYKIENQVPQLAVGLRLNVF